MYRINITKLNKKLGLSNNKEYIIDNFDRSKHTYNYNTIGSEPWNKGIKLTAEHRQSMRDAKKKSPVWNKGKKGLQKSTRKGVPRSEETKRKIAEATRMGMKKYYENRTSN